MMRFLGNGGRKANVKERERRWREKRWREERKEQMMNEKRMSGMFVLSIQYFVYSHKRQEKGEE